MTLMLLALLVHPSWAEPVPSAVPVFVSILPQAYFLERIGGDRVHVEVLVGEGQSPHTYEPPPRQMALLSKAKAWFLIGVPFERPLVKKMTSIRSEMVFVQTQKGVPYRTLERHDHGKPRLEAAKSNGHQSAGIPDPHIWMSPRLVKIQAQNIYDALVQIDPSGRAWYQENLQSFLKDLDRVDANIARALAPVRGRKMYVFHPAFGYFADAYGLTQVPIEIGGKEPGARQLANLIERAKADGVRVIFVQPQFSLKSAGVVAKAIGGAVLPINPLSRDYLSNLEQIAAAIDQGLR